MGVQMLVLWAAAVVAGLAVVAHASWHDSIMPKRYVKLGEYLQVCSAYWSLLLSQFFCRKYFPWLCSKL